MATSDNLSQLEVLALSAVMMLRDSAYGMTIHAQVEELAKGERRLADLLIERDKREYDLLELLRTSHDTNADLRKRLNRWETWFMSVPAIVVTSAEPGAVSDG